MAFAEVLNLSSFILYTMYTYNCKGHVVNIYVARSRLLYLYIEKKHQVSKIKQNNAINTVRIRIIFKI